MGRNGARSDMVPKGTMFLSIIMLSIISVTLIVHPIEVHGRIGSSQWASPTGGPQHLRRSPYDGKGIMGGKDWATGLGKGAISPPVIGENGLIYLSLTGSSDKINGVHCLDGDGRIIWSKFLDGPRLYGPVLDNDGNVVIAYEDLDGAGYIVRYGPYGEQLLMRMLDGVPIKEPVIDREGSIYLSIERTTSECYLCKFTAGGILQWDFSNWINAFSLPTITDTGNVGVMGHYLYFLLNSDGEEVWSEWDISSEEPALFYDGKLFFLETCSVDCYDLEGRSIWSFELKEGYVGPSIALTPDDCLVFFDDEGHVFKIDLNGDLIWKKDNYYGGTRNLICAGDGYLFTQKDGDLYQADDRGNLIWSTWFYDDSTGFGNQGAGGIALSSDGSLYYTNSGFLIKVKGIDVSTPLTVAWFSLFFIMIGTTIGAFVLYQKRSIKVIRKEPPLHIREPPPHPSPAYMQLQCPNCSRTFVPRSRQRIVCPFCGMAGEVDSGN